MKCIIAALALVASIHAPGTTAPPTVSIAPTPAPLAATVVRQSVEPTSAPAYVPQYCPEDGNLLLGDYWWEWERNHDYGSDETSATP